MQDSSRGLRASIVAGLAKVGLVWSLTVLATVFAVSAAQGSSGPTGGLAPASVAGGTAPHQAGLALAVAVLAVDVTVLAKGALAAAAAPYPCAGTPRSTSPTSPTWPTWPT